LNAAGQANHNAGEDQQAHAVANAAVGNLLAQPHDEGGSGGERNHGHQDEADSGVQDVGDSTGAVGEGKGDGQRLHGTQNHGDVAGPLRDFAPPQLPFFLQLSQWLVNHGEQLEDDGGGDVGHDAQGEDGQAAKVAAAEQIDEAEGAARLLVKELRQQLEVHAGGRYLRAQTIYGQDTEGEQDPLAQVGDAEDISDLLKHKSRCLRG
jgi:hypothetical protein